MLTSPPPTPPPPPPSTLYSIINIIVFGFLLYVIDAVIYNTLGWFAKDGVKENPDLPLMLVGYFVGAILFVKGYEFYARNLMRYYNGKNQVNPSGEITVGLAFGVFASLIVFLPSALIDTAVFEGLEIGAGLGEVAFRAVQFGVGGVIVAYLDKKIYKYGDIT